MKRLRILNRHERELRAFEKRNKPDKIRRYDKKLAQVMDAYFIIVGKVKQALNDCIPEELPAPVAPVPLRSVAPSEPEPIIQPSVETRPHDPDRDSATPNSEHPTAEV